MGGEKKGGKKMKKKIIGIFVMALLIVTTFPAVETAEENKKCEISCLKIEDPGAISTTMLDQVDLQQTTNTGSERVQQLDSGGLAQSFKPTKSTLSKISVLLTKTSGSPEFVYYYFEIRTDIHSSTYLRKIQIAGNEIPSGLIWITWDFSDFSVTPGNNYYIVVYASSPTIYSTQIKWCYGSPGDPYPNGGSMINYGPPLYWAAYDIWGDFCFKTHWPGGGNNPPNKPTTPSGPTTGNIGDSLHYESYISDPEGDGMEVYFDWGDGTHTGWVGILTNGTVGNYKTWTTADTYQVRVKTRDTPYLEESPWSDPLSVTIGNGGNTQPNKPETPDGPTS